MKKIILFWIIILITAAGIVACDSKKISIKGHWTSIEAEDLGNKTFRTREFKIDNENWEVIATLYLDKGKKNPVFAFRGKGPYTIEGKSPYLFNTFNGIFSYNNIYITILNNDPNILKRFGFINLINLEKDINVEKDITETGFAFFPSVKNYPKEYDIVKIENGHLYFGARGNNDLSTPEKRPKTFNYPLKKN